MSSDRPFIKTVVQLAIGVLFIAISATVTPASLRGVIWPAGLTSPGRGLGRGLALLVAEPLRGA